MSEHWHLYCDEAGQFEDIREWEKSIIFGMLVPDKDKDELSFAYRALAKKHGIQDGFIHGKDLYNKTEYQNFRKSLVSLTLDSPLRLFCIRYEEDRLSGYIGKIDETFACNRYLYMMQIILEHVLFLIPKDYGKDMTFSLFPNTRVFPCKKEQFPKLKALGFNVKARDRNKYMVDVWDNTGLRVFVSRLQEQYSRFQPIIGSRQLSDIEMQVAKHSEDAFVHWVDNLAGVLKWKDSIELSNMLDSNLHVNITYGLDENRYKQICHEFLKEKTRDFIIQYLANIGSFKTEYYQKQLKELIDIKLGRARKYSHDELIELEMIVDEHIRLSSGKWEFISGMVEFLLNNIDAEPEELKLTQEFKALQFRLYNHMLTCHNHRGEVLPAWEVVKKAERLEIVPNTVDEWRESLEFKNRQAISAANLFAFEYGNQMLVPELKNLEAIAGHLRGTDGHILSDPLVGKLRGTVAQNYAFLAPFSPELFNKAESTFLASKSQFAEPQDILRQNIYLAHMYMDWKRHDKVKDIFNEIMEDKSVKLFLEAPSRESAYYMQFILALMLKLGLYLDIVNLDTLATYSYSNLEKWFGQAKQEHPFEFIFAYLGRVAFLHRNYTLADSMFTDAMSIPPKGQAVLQPTLQAIRAEILVWWAMELNRAGHEETAMAKMGEAYKIVQRIGLDDSLSPILSIDGDKAVFGWFAKGYMTLHSIMETGKIEDEICGDFLKCFTFNYC